MVNSKQLPSRQGRLSRAVLHLLCLSTLLTGVSTGSVAAAIDMGSLPSAAPAETYVVAAAGSLTRRQQTDSPNAEQDRAYQIYLPVISNPAAQVDVVTTAQAETVSSDQATMYYAYLPTIAHPASQVEVTTLDTVEASLASAAQPVIFEKRVTTGNDDGEESSSGSVSLSGSDLELVVDGSTNQTVGVRFTGVALPKGSTINSAYVQFGVDEVSTAAASLTIQGQAADNAAALTTASRNLSSRGRTTAALSWTPASWPTVGQSGVNQRTPNLAAIVQEIINRPGWASGNALVILFTGSGRRTAYAYEGKAASAPLLHIEYTPASSNTAVTFVGAGDIAGCSSKNDDATALLLDQIPGTVFTLGDNVYSNGSASEFANCYQPTWGRHKARTRPAVGNHDYHIPGAADYFSYFGAAAGEPGKGYYSYNLGAWHIVVLNSECAEIGGCTRTSVQGQWLRADLKANPARCTLAIWHKPRVSSGQYGSYSGVADFWQILYDAGADIVLNGHDHIYERFALQNPSLQADAARGLRQFTVGTGGAGLYTIGTVRANSEARTDQAHGVLKLTLRSTSYDWQFVPIAGQTYTDSGTTTCNTYTPPAVSAAALTDGAITTGETTLTPPLESSNNKRNKYP